MLEDDSVQSKQSNSDRRNLLSEYVNSNLLAFQYLRNRNYKTACITFEKCLDISLELDEVKYVESLTNAGVCQYFCGKFVDSYNSLEKAKQISNKLIENYLNDKSIQYLHLRVLCNLSLTSLSLNRIQDCRTNFKECIELVRSQLELEEKVRMLKELVFIFFRIDSLQNYYEQNENFNAQTNEAHQDNDASVMNGKMISRTFYALHKTLRENNIEHWIKCLNEEGKKLRFLKDISGYVFVLINSFAANFYQNGKITENIKSSYSKIIKIYAEQYNKDLKIKEKNLNIIFSDFRSRIDMAMEIYKKLIETETELNNLMPDAHDLPNSVEKPNKIDETVSNKILIKLFFKHSLRQLNEIPNPDDSEKVINANNAEIKNQIELALKLLENNELDCSKLNIFNINSEITKSLKLLFENMITIRNKCLLNYYFKDYMKKTFDFYSILVKRQVKSDEYMESKFEQVKKGGIIVKVHYSSSGFSKYFYKVNPKTQSLNIYKSVKAHTDNADKPYKTIPFQEIKSIIYGLSTTNLKKRYKNLNDKKLNSPWLFLSLVLTKRSIDLYFENEDNLMTWFYGLSYFIRGNKLSTKVPTTYQFVFQKLKLKLICKLKEIAEKDEKNPNKSLLILSQLNNYITTNEMGFHSLSIVQVLLLYKKIVEKQASNII